MNILECCRYNEVNSLIYASSSSVYGSNTNVPFSESDKVDSPLSIYGASKKSNELMAHSYSHLFGINTIGLRFFTVYGPWGRPDMALNIFTDNIIHDRPIEIFNNGNHCRSFTYIDDVIESIFRLISIRKKTNSYSILNIGGQNSVNLMDYISTIEKILSKKANYKFLPMQPGDVEKTEADTTLLQKTVGFSPQIDIENGIKKFIEWYKFYYV